MIQMLSSHSDRYGSCFLVYGYEISSCNDNILGIAEKSKRKNKNFLLRAGCGEQNPFQN